MDNGPTREKNTDWTLDIGLTTKSNTNTMN